MGIVVQRETINFDESDYLAGLCPVCKQPIRLSLVHGGKLSPSRRTLDCRHVFSGNVKCENRETLAQIANMSGQEKNDFFNLRHDRETIKDMPADYQREQLHKMWPNNPEFFPPAPTAAAPP